MSHQSQHTAHGDQHSEHGAWLSDCLNWRVDHVQALSTLARVEAMIKRHEAEVAEHELIIGGHERANVLQEALMARAERGASDESSEDADQFLGNVHEQQKNRHYLLRQRHVALMARVLELEKALADLG
ncbi:MAG: hypothetical protein H6738_19120 [Alphaproteobacteria bacterium]|nr:hypothetical protein [Alphaproteobacteria bacterium]MCB9698901.1 hypothetical protein [Alphaproteobacteria bacterium]